jgi:AIG2-like family.
MFGERSRTEQFQTYQTMSNLFVYGTLLSNKIWKSIVTREYSSDSAVLKGYARKKVKGKNYPGLIEQDGSVVEGKIYYDVFEEDFGKLDAYEGEEYARKKVYVLLESAKNVECFTYLFKKEYFGRLTKNEWALIGFLYKKTRINPTALQGGL